MKFIYTTIFLLLMSAGSLFAQIEQGKFFINAQSNISFSSMDRELKSDGDDQDLGKIKKFEFSPSLGYFVGDGLLVGLAVPFSSEKNEDGDGDYIKTNQIGFMPFARYYFNNGGSKTKPYFHGGFGIGSATQKDNDSNEADYRLSSYELGGGLAIFFHKNIAVDLGLGYSSSTMKPKDDNDNDAKLVTNGLSFKVGFTFCI
jgi:outer membrane protein